MKKVRVFIGTILMTLLLGINSFADTVDSSSNYWDFNEYISVNKEILGDIYTAGNEIKIGKNTEGDIISAGKILDVTSQKVKGNIRSMSQTLNINSEGIKNITSMAQNIDIGDKTKANGIYLWGEKINFKGNCKGFYALGKSIIINGKIDGDISVNCDELIFADNADVKGKIEVSSPNEPILNSKISMNDIKYTKTIKKEEKSKVNVLFSFSTIVSIMSSLILGFVIYLLFKKQFSKCENLLVYEPLKIILGGIATFILIPIISILLMITVIGVPLGIISLLIYFIIVYLSTIIMGIIFGRIILKDKNPYLQTFVGIVILKILSILPIIGKFVWIISSIIVQGYLVYLAYKSIKYKEKTI